MNKVLSNKIYYTTFILAILVIALHSSYLEFLNPNLSGYDFSFISQRIILVIGEAAVPSFFVISGYLLFRNFELKKYPRMLLSKVFSLVIPYFIWSVIAFLFMRLLWPVFTGEAVELTFKSVLVDILLANNYPHLWFIRPLVVYFICSPILYFIFKYLKKWSIFIPTILFFIYMFFRPIYGGLLLFIPHFFVGAYLAYFKIPTLNKHRPKLVGIITTVIFVSISVVFSITHAGFEDYAFYCYRFFSPLFVWFSFDLLKALFEKDKVHDIFKTSGFIFFSHLFIVNAFKILFELGIKTDSNYNCTLLFFLVLLVSTVMTLLLTYVLKRFAKPVYKLLGGR